MSPFLQKPLTTLALCWRLERRDGVALGFTTHDRDLEIGGLLYRAAPGMLPSAIALSDGFEAESLDVEGALTSAAISAGDLARRAVGRRGGGGVHGRLGGAGGRDLCRRARRARRGLDQGDAFEAELRGSAALLDAPVVEQTSPECRAELGDKRCRVDMAARTVTTRIAAVGGRGDGRGRGGGGGSRLMRAARCAGSAAPIAGSRAAMLASADGAADSGRAAALRAGRGRPRRDPGGLRQEPRDLRGRGSPMPRISAASRICPGSTC